MSNDPASYDDDAELTRYVFHNFSELLTDVEKLSERAILAEQKAHATGERIAKALRERWGSQNDPQVVEALKDGPDVFRQRVRDRLLESHADEIVINRCPNCQRIVATPKARQCLWCGHDWHDEREDL